MITIIQATNRPDSNSEFVSRQIADMLHSMGHVSVNTVSMTDLPDEILHPKSYAADTVPEGLIDLQD
jgi:hypothetical protein